MRTMHKLGVVTIAWLTVVGVVRAPAQVVPSAAEVRAYRGLFAAAASGNNRTAQKLLANGANPNAIDGYGRTPAHVAAHFRRRTTLATLLRNGTKPNALERDGYDIITIAAVANDPETIRVALRYGAKATNITSRYDGTALIAAAHLGNVESVRVLVAAHAPLNHVNNLHWTALLEAVILGDGGPRHMAIVKILVDAGADVNLGDASGVTALGHATSRGYTDMAELLRNAGARPVG